jgi:hypothetical protein
MQRVKSVRCIAAATHYVPPTNGTVRLTRLRNLPSGIEGFLVKSRELLNMI